MPQAKEEKSKSNKSSSAKKNEDDRGVAFGTSVAYDDVYGGEGPAEYITELPTDQDDAREVEEMNDEGRISSHPSTMAARRAEQVRTPDNQFVKSAVNIANKLVSFESSLQAAQDDDPFQNASGGSGLVNTRIADRESDYQKRRQNRVLREDGMSYKEAMTHANLDKERHELIEEAKKLEEGGTGTISTTSTENESSAEGKRRKRRWDNGSSSTNTEALKPEPSLVSDNDSIASKSNWDEDTTSTTAGAGRRRKRWDETPVASSAAAPDATPLVGGASKWDETPIAASGATVAATPSAVAGKKNRWDQTPLASGSAAFSSAVLATPATGTLAKAMALEREMESRNRPWTDAALDAILPTEGYTIIRPPSNYVPLRTPGRKLLATPTPLGMTPQGFQMEVPVEERSDTTLEEIRQAYGVPLAPSAGETGDMGALPHIKPEDMQYFGRLMEEADESRMTKEEANERKIMALLLKIKSGTPPQRKTAMRQITDRARSFGAGPLFNQILPLLMSPTLEDQERHLLVKVIDRVLYKLDDLVRPYVHRILAVIEPLLIDEDYYARVEGREIISNLAKAAGLATMIATMRPDIDNPDEYVRNTTARAFAVVACALGVPTLLPFLKAVCQSRKSWQARHTGIKIVQQIALLMGVAVLPYLRELVDIVSHGLTDEMPKVRIITALTLAALAEAAYPYGIESFDSVIRPLWKGALEHHGKGLAAFLKAIGFVIPLMEENYASHYTRLVMPILLREFHSPDEEMKRIVLKVIQQCVATAGVEPDYIRKEILPEFFKNFWIRRMALDRRNYQQVIETTEELANKVGCSDIISRIVDDLKDDSEPYRRMVMETVNKVLTNLGAGDIDERLEERLIDGILYAFQEQAVDASITSANSRESQIMLDGFGTVVNSLGERCKPYLKQITGTIKWRLNNKAASVRMQAADLIARIAVVMKACGEDQLMGHLGVVLYEYLGEEYPEVLGSILGALRAIVNVIGMTKMTPPIRDLLPRLTPILRNRHEKVQENCIDLVSDLILCEVMFHRWRKLIRFDSVFCARLLVHPNLSSSNQSLLTWCFSFPQVGRIADRGAEFVSAKEWMRICFELLEMLRAHKKAIRRAAVSTFGYIARAIGPLDVLHTLLNNLKVQDRQMRVCTTVAIAIVAETCGPFAVLPALMNEYRVPELNIQNGVLKAMSFMFEYIGDMGKDYIYAVTPLLEDALMDRDPVHRQTACATVKHLSLGVAGLGCDDALIHLLNFVWPNIFEESPHVIQAVFDAIQGLMVALGPNLILQYTLQGLYHPARKVREVYWRVFNTLYMYNSDALVMGYPHIEDEGENAYARTTLELFI
jgi:splicing factor 3B subunit 1